MLSDKIYILLQSSITWGVVTLVLAAIAASGRFSVTLSNVILLCTFFIGCFGIYRAGLSIHFLIILCLLLGVVLAFISWWITPNPSSPTVIQSENLKQPTAEEIAAAVAKQISIQKNTAVKPLKLKTIQPAQFLPDDQGGIYIVIPDVQLTNINDAATIVNVDLLIKEKMGGLVHYEASASRIREVEIWLDKNHLANSNFIGRQINVPPNSAINGYMCFYSDKFKLEMSNQTIESLSHSPYFFHIEQIGVKTRDISSGEAIIGHDAKSTKSTTQSKSNN